MAAQAVLTAPHSDIRNTLEAQCAEAGWVHVVAHWAPTLRAERRGHRAPAPVDILSDVTEAVVNPEWEVLIRLGPCRGRND